MSSVSIMVLFQYGSRGATVTALVQTSFDDGVTWDDIARFEFATVSDKKRAAVSTAASYEVASVDALASETILDAHLGDRLRAKVTSTGTYADTSLGIRAAVR